MQRGIPPAIGWGIDDPGVGQAIPVVGCFGHVLESFITKRLKVVNPAMVYTCCNGGAAAQSCIKLEAHIKGILRGKGNDRVQINTCRLTDIREVDIQG